MIEVHEKRKGCYEHMVSKAKKSEKKRLNETKEKSV